MKYFHLSNLLYLLHANSTYLITWYTTISTSTFQLFSPSPRILGQVLNFSKGMEIDVSLLIFNFQMWKAAFTELLATAFLVFTLTTTIISILDSHEVEPKLLVPLAIFLVLFLFLMTTVPLSGGHMNPILTFIAALKGLITLALPSTTRNLVIFNGWNRWKYYFR